MTNGPRRQRATRDRLAASISAIAEIREDDPGWTRRVFGEPDRVAREAVASLMAEAGLDAHIDAAGNVVGRLSGTAGTRAALVTGSHTDTVSGGGRFDGVVGVLGGIEAARALRESGVRVRHDLVVVDFLGEEPNDFGISCVGSRALAGTLSPEHLALNAMEGGTLAEAMILAGADPDQSLRIAWSPQDVHRYFELHIEQGPHLERLGRSIGVVTGIVGIQRFRARFQGRADHAGTATMDMRHDAGLAAAEMMLAIEALATGEGVATTGRAKLLPGATNVVPAGALLECECRSLDSSWFANFRANLDGGMEEIASHRRTPGRIEWLTIEPPTPMDAVATDTILRAARHLDYEVAELASYAGHDAVQMANLGACGMLFVPSQAGRSHCPEEWTDFEDAARGIDVLVESLLLADQD